VFILLLRGCWGNFGFRAYKVLYGFWVKIKGLLRRFWLVERVCRVVFW
jgi:hypothetical protein